jgi:hypothetical protein
VGKMPKKKSLNFCKNLKSLAYRTLTSFYIYLHWKIALISIWLPIFAKPKKYLLRKTLFFARKVRLAPLLLLKTTILALKSLEKDKLFDSLSFTSKY